jgi:AcrR family transcriptional regulator
MGRGPEAARRGALAAEPAAGQLSKRAQATRTALLAGARHAFAEHGFERATVADIVVSSGASVGSLYNQFGGKEQLFLELHRRYRAQQWQLTQRAMDAARAAGESDPFRVYLAGARAYLMGCWADRDLARVFLSGDGPPGFDAVTRGAVQEWISQNAGVLQVEGQRFGEALASAVTGVVVAGARQVVRCQTRDDAVAMTEYFAGLVARLAQPAPQAAPGRAT